MRIYVQRRRMIKTRQSQLRLRPIQKSYRMPSCCLALCNVARDEPMDLVSPTCQTADSVYASLPDPNYIRKRNMRSLVI